MASITIRNLDDNIKAKLRVQAAQHGLSMEQEAREILRANLNKTEHLQGSFLERIRSRFAGYHLQDLQIPPRELPRDPPDFSNQFKGITQI